MSTTNLTAGFYGTDEHICYVTTSGKIYCVQSDDLVSLPRRWDSLPDGFEPIDDSVIGPDEFTAHLDSIREEYGADATD